MRGGAQAQLMQADDGFYSKISKTIPNIAASWSMNAWRPYF